MKIMAVVLLGLLLFALPSAADKTNPLSKVLELLESLSKEITSDGEAEEKAYKHYFEWCDDAARTLHQEIKTAEATIEKLKASIAKSSSDIEVSTSKIEDLSGSIATLEAELKTATGERHAEETDFVAAEAELEETISALSRALAILDRESAKNPAAFAQVDMNNFDKLIQSLGAVVDAAGLSGSDRDKLVALVQARQSEDSDDEDDDADANAPSASVYKSHSSGVMEVLEDMKEKAEEELGSARKSESQAKHNYEMLKQSMLDQSGADTKDLDEEKSAKASAEEAKATAEGNLEMTEKALKAAKEKLALTQKDCMQVASDHEVTVKSRVDELKVIAEAVKILKETSGGAVEETYSFIQVKADSNLDEMVHTELTNSKVVNLVKNLAKVHHSSALAQLASRISAVVRYGDADPFAKIKGLIQDLIGKLEQQAAAEAQEKAFCDEELAKTTAKKEELEDDVSKLTTKIDQSAAASAKLKEQVKTLQAELAELSKSQAKLDQIRIESHKEYEQAKADLEKGLEGVRGAIAVLKDYYSSDEGDASLIQDDSFDSFMQQPAKPANFEKSEGAGSSIIGILEVVESDFAKNLAAEETKESDEAEDYSKTTQANKIIKAEKEQDVKYKTQEFTALDKAIAELSSDRETESTELAAVNEYYAELQERCIAKPEAYEERKKRRDSEIAGLKEALSVLENEAAFVQRKHRGSMRGAAILASSD